MHIAKLIYDRLKTANIKSTKITDTKITGGEDFTPKVRIHTVRNSCSYFSVSHILLYFNTKVLKNI